MAAFSGVGTALSFRFVESEFGLGRRLWELDLGLGTVAKLKLLYMRFQCFETKLQ